MSCGYLRWTDPAFTNPLHSPIMLGRSILTKTHYRLEERRKAKGAAYYERKKAAARQLSEAKKNAKVDDKTAKALEAYGY